MARKPKALITFYQSLESLESLDLWYVHNQLATCSNLADLWQKNLITERKVLHFNLDNGQLESNTQITDVKGNVINVIEFSLDEIEYLKSRLDQTSNDWLKARYANVIWLKVKHNDFASVAIEHYIKSLLKVQPDKIGDFSRNITAFLYLAKKTKEKIEEVKATIFEIIEAVPYWMKANVLEAMLDNNIFEKSELTEVANQLDSWINFEDTKNYHTNRKILHIGIELNNKLSRSSKQYFGLLAQNEDLILITHDDDHDFVKFTTVGNKVKFLLKSDNKEELDRTLQEYTRLKQFVNLNKVTVELDDEKLQLFNDYLNQRSKAILKNDSASILAYFAMHESVLVDPIETESSASKSMQVSIRNLFSVSQIDINTNFKNIDNSEKFNSKYISHYALAHNINFTSIFNKVFVDGIIAGKLNYYKIYSFLETHTWYGFKFVRQIKDDEIEQNANWLSLLAPGLHNLFSQFELGVLMNNNKINNFILSIDSLTIKFEGALRDFIRLNNGSTTTEKKGELQEQLLEELLENPVTKKYFSEKDLGLFKYTFTKKGKNLRNNIAHSFLSYSDYNLNLASLVFLCILRLGKYQINATNSH